MTLPQTKFTITKKIAKHGKQAIIVIPRAIEHKLKPGTLTEVQISVLEEPKIPKQAKTMFLSPKI